MEQKDIDASQKDIDKTGNGAPSDENDPARLVRVETLRGQRPGDQRVRMIYPAHSSLRHVDAGILEATPETEIPKGGWGRLRYNVKRFLIGAPLANVQLEQERLTRFKALAVLSSDAISSVAYATEASLLALVAGGSVSLWVELPIALAIILLLAIVALSYRQTIPAYPNGGGSYIVAKDNLGQLPGLIAAASLLIDYVLTVAVSISSGVLALATLFPALQPYVVPIDVALVILVTVVNLRGVRESGSVFSIPTYLFIGSAVLLIIVGVIKSFFIAHHPLVGQFHFVEAAEPLTLYLILRSFAAGCSAMTGVEAISNGIPAFKKPETHNAAITLTWMAVILGTLLLGITVLATSYGIEANPQSNPTVIGQIAIQVFDPKSPLAFMFPVFQISTLLILVLAANTSYSDFPRLASILARDNFLPHQFAFRGDRLAFSIGIMFLAILASLLLVAFKGDTTNLINLYAIGVFMSFTLSQSGMVLHWWRLRNEHKGWSRSLVINGLGALTTLIVALVIAYTKFFSGAWIVVVLIPLLVLMFEAIHRHYTRVERERISDIPIHPKDIRHRLIVPMARLNGSAKQSLSYARSISEHVIALHISGDEQGAESLRMAWHDWQQQLTTDERSQLEIIDLDHHTVVHQVLAYIDNAHREFPAATITVMLPEVEVDHWWEYFLRNRTAIQLKTSLLFRPGIVVTDISPYKQPGTTSIRQREEQLFVPEHPKAVKHLFIVPIAGLDKVSKQTLAYARSISNQVIAVHVSIDTSDAEKIRNDWEVWKKHLAPEEKTELVVIESPYRSLSRPLLNYIDTMHELYPDYAVTVMLPEFVVAHWWEYALHNQTAFQLKTSLLFRPGIIVTSVPQHLPSRVHENRQPMGPIVPV